MSWRTILHVGLFALALFAPIQGPQAVKAQTKAAEARAQMPKWFVMRNGKTGYCQPALLISIGGDYRNRSALKAGGPYSTEEEAIAQIEALEANRICTKS